MLDHGDNEMAAKKPSSKKASPKASPKSSTATKTATKTATSTKTSTDAYTQGNVTVTGGAGDGNTTVHIGSALKKLAKKRSSK